MVTVAPCRPPPSLPATPRNPALPLPRCWPPLPDAPPLPGPHGSSGTFPSTLHVNTKLTSSPAARCMTASGTVDALLW